MSLKDRLIKEKQDQEQAERDAAERLPVALGATQVLLRAVKAYLVENEIEFKDGKANLTEVPVKGWQSTPFPTLLVVVRNHAMRLQPRGFTPEGFRVDLTCGGCPQYAFCFMWNGNGNSINDWEMFPVFSNGRVDRTKGSQVSNEWLDPAFTKLAGFED